MPRPFLYAVHHALKIWRLPSQTVRDIEQTSCRNVTPAIAGYSAWSRLTDCQLYSKTENAHAQTIQLRIPCTGAGFVSVCGLIVSVKTQPYESQDDFML